MSTALAIDQLETWSHSLGLMPVPLFGQAAERRHVLLNGSKGNFCLDLADEDAEEGTERDRAWSSDVGHYIKVNRDKVRVWRWDQTQPEEYSHRLVADNIVKFQNYLEERQPTKTESIVSHFISIYRQVRNLLGADVAGPDALQAFLYILASAEAEGGRHAAAIDWPKLPRAQELASLLSTSDRDLLVHDMRSTRSGDQLRPILPLVMRHASGRLFQEAHYLVELDPQQGLFSASEAKRANRDSSAQGAYFTPSSLVRTVVEEAFKAQPVPDRAITIVDPACGSAEFLREALRQLEIRGHAHQVRLVGWDVSEAALAMAHFMLGWERSRSNLQIEIALDRRDALADADWRERPDYALMNPPFISWQEMGVDKRDHVTHVLGDLAMKRPDYASAFWLQAVNSLSATGVIGTVLPASLLDGASYVRLRECIASKVNPHLIARLGSHTVFAEAMVDAGLYIGTKAQLARDPLAVWSNHKAESSSRVLRRLRSITADRRTSVVVDEDGYSVYPVPGLGRDGTSWAPRSVASYGLLQQVRHLPKAEAIFDVSQGVITGLNGAFLVNRAYAESLPKPVQRHFRPAVVNNSISNGVLNTSVFVFYPYGKESITSEGQLEQKLGAFYNDVLLPQKQALSNRTGFKERWWCLTRPRERLSAMGPKIISTYFGGAGSFGWDSVGDHVPVQGYAWSLKDDALAGTELAYLALLNHPVMDTLLPGVSNNLAGGQWNLSERFVNQLPMPALDLEDGVTAVLISIGTSITKGEQPDRELWDDAVRRVFGINKWG